MRLSEETRRLLDSFEEPSRFYLISESCGLQVRRFRNVLIGRHRNRMKPYEKQEQMFYHYSHSMASVLPSRHSSYTQFSASTRNACRRMTRCRVSSASGTKAGTTSKTFFKLRALSFCFCPKVRGGVAFGGSMAPKTPVLKLNRPFARKPPAAIASELTRVACAPFAKPQVAGLRHS